MITVTRLEDGEFAVSVYGNTIVGTFAEIGFEYISLLSKEEEKVENLAGISALKYPDYEQALIALWPTIPKIWVIQEDMNYPNLLSRLGAFIGYLQTGDGLAFKDAVDELDEEASQLALPIEIFEVALKEYEDYECLDFDALGYRAMPDTLTEVIDQANEEEEEYSAFAESFGHQDNFGFGQFP